MSSQLLSGTVDVLILKTLSQGPAHGFGVSRSIRRRSGGELRLEEAALYQALHRLESRGAIEAEWGLSENNRRAKYYVLTKRGREELRRAERSWRRYADAVLSVLEPASEGSTP